MNFSLTLVAALASAILMGCASVGELEIGQRRDAVLAKLGAPAQKIAITGGERWTYTGGPEGHETWMLEFDAAGALVRRDQVLTLPRIAQIAVGLKQTEVEALIGPSKWTKRFPFLPDELVYIYRYRDDRVPMCFYVTYGAASSVVNTGSLKEIQGSERRGPPC